MRKTRTMAATRTNDNHLSNVSIAREVYDFSMPYKNDSLWRNCVCLQFNSYWIGGILASVMLTFMFTTWELALVSTPSDEDPSILYFVGICDVVYLIDFIMALVYKLNEELKGIAVHVPRRGVFLTIDFLSLIPLDLIALTADFEEYYYTVRINRAFRLYRIFSFLVKVQNSVHYKIVHMRMLEHLIYLILLIHLFACLMEFSARQCVIRFEFRIICGTNISIETKFKIYRLLVYLIAGRVTLRGIEHISGIICMDVRSVLLAATFTSFVLIKGFVLAHSTSALIQSKYQFLCLSNRLTVVKKFMDGTNISPKLRQKVLNYYDCLWKKRYRVMNTINLPFLPQSVRNEINLDLSWDLFKHAHLFKVLPVSFCRNVSNYVKYDSYQRGDLIYRKDEVKDRMIYICSGNVQVLVTDDDDTALCSLSSGTCLGEASLVVGLINKFSVRSSSYCEVLSLETKSFIKLIQKTPIFNRYVHRRISARIQNAKDLHFLPEKLKLEGINRPQKKSMMWLKSMFKLLTKNKKTDIKSEVDEGSCWFDDLLYTPKYLDLIAFSEKLELVMDSVCLKTTWPWILQPNSVLTEFWDTVVLIVVIIASFVIPYCAAFTVSWTQSFILSCILFELIFLADVYVQATTAIRTKEGLISEWRDIFLIRLTHLGFLADCVACIPFSFIGYIVSGISQQIAAKLTMNALIKLWKVESFFTKLELSFVDSTAYIRLIKWTCYIYFMIYLAAVLLHVLCHSGTHSITPGHCWLATALENEQLNDHLILSLLFSYMTSMGKTYSNLKVMDTYEMISVTIIYILSAFLYICALSSVCAAKILLKGHRLRFYEGAKSLVALAEAASLDKIMKQRLIAHLKAQWHFNEGITVLFGVSTFYDTTEAIYSQIMEETHVEIFKNIQLLKGCNKDLILKLASAAELHLIPPNEIIIHIGEVPKEMHVIVHGYCEVISVLSQSMNKILGPNDIFCAVEMLLKVPLGSSVKTSTFCKILTLTYDSFMQIISSYQQDHKTITSVIGNLQKIKEIPHHGRDFSTMPVAVTYQKEVKKSFKWFGYDILKGSREEEDYNMPFKGHPQLKFISYFLIRCSILPDGHFIEVWESMRAIFAFLTAILYPVYALFPMTALFYVLKFLDATAYLDLYVRMHVAYYDKNKLLVTHPIKTAGNYLKRSFLLDLIACFPFEIFVYSQGIVSMTQKRELLYSYINRILQMYRPVLGVKYLQGDIFKCHTFIRGTKYLLYSFVYINWVTCGLLVHTCVIDDNIKNTFLYTEGIDCGEDSWIGQSDFEKPLSPLRIYFYAFHWVTALHAVNEIYGIKVTSHAEAIFVMVLISIGYIYTMSVYSSVISAQQTRNIKLTTYQERMKSLVNFMKTNKIADDMQREAINHFELIWMRKRGREIQESFSTFHCGLKEDILYNIYGAALRKSKLFQKASKPLCDRILAEAIMKLYRKKAPVLQINDIHSKLYIVNKGRVDVVGPDGVRLATVGTGSMFGNLDDAARIRQTVAVAARDHTELLITDAQLFYRILEDYPQIKNKLALLTKLHMDFIPGETSENQPDIKLDDYESSTSKYSSVSIVIKLKNLKNIVFSPESTIVQLWEVITCTVCAYIHYVTALYQVVFHEYSLWLLILVYLVDIVCIIRIYFRFRTGYEDEFGNIVRDSKKIAKRYLRSPLGFYLDFVTLFPFGLFCFLAPYGQRQFYFGLLRLTKIPRVLFMMKYFDIWNDKLNINVFFMKFGYITIFISVALHFYACCYLALIEFMDYEDLSGLPSGTKLKVYCEVMFSCVHIFTCTHFHGIIAHKLSITLFLILMIHMSQLSTMTFIGGLCSLIEIVNHSMSKYSRSIISVKDYLKENNVYPAVLNQYWKYVCYLWETTRGAQFPILLSEAPYHLQESIKVQAYGYHIYSNYVFSQCHPDFLRQLITKLKYEVYFCGNYVAFQGDINNCMYFVHSGKVTVLLENQDSSENVINELSAGDVFGMMQGLHDNTPHNYTFRVATFSVILTLDFHKWSYLLPFFLPSREEIYKRANRVHHNQSL